MFASLAFAMLTGAPAMAQPDAVRLCTPGSTDPVDVLDAWVASNRLFVDVEYSGGCATHRFGACWEGSFQESFPVQARLQLGHDDGNDACDGLVQETLSFDLRLLRLAYVVGYGPGPAVILLNVDGLRVPYFF